MWDIEVNFHLLLLLLSDFLYKLETPKVVYTLLSTVSVPQLQSDNYSDDESSGVNPMVSKFAEEIDSDTEYDPVVVEDKAEEENEQEKEEKILNKRASKAQPPLGGFDSLFNAVSPNALGSSGQMENDGSGDLEDFLGDDPLGGGGGQLAAAHEGYDSL
jgi:hypothetical protein